MIDKCLEQHGSLIDPLLNGSLDDAECILDVKEIEDSIKDDIEESVLTDSQAINLAIEVAENLEEMNGEDLDLGDICQIPNYEFERGSIIKNEKTPNYSSISKGKLCPNSEDTDNKSSTNLKKLHDNIDMAPSNLSLPLEKREQCIFSTNLDKLDQRDDEVYSELSFTAVKQENIRLNNHLSDNSSCKVINTSTIGSLCEKNLSSLFAGMKLFDPEYVSNVDPELTTDKTDNRQTRARSLALKPETYDSKLKDDSESLLDIEDISSADLLDEPMHRINKALRYPKRNSTLRKYADAETGVEDDIIIRE